MLRRHIVLMIVICPLDGYIKPGGPLGAFWEQQAMSRHQVSPSPFLSSFHTTQTVTHTVTLTSTSYSRQYRYSYPTCNVVCPSGVWFENRSHSTPSILPCTEPEVHNSAVSWHWNNTHILIMVVIIIIISLFSLTCTTNLYTNFHGLNPWNISVLSRDFPQKF